MSCPYETEFCKNNVHCQTCGHYKEYLGNLTATCGTVDNQAEWILAMDDFEEGFGYREYPHCSNCSRGVYKHDAGTFCPFCGKSMKNPMR